MVQGQRAQLQTAVLPAPVHGLDGTQNIASNDPLNTIYSYNLIPAEYGMRTRLGHREWSINIGSGPGAAQEVRSVLPYEGIAGVTVDKLFAFNIEGVWDVTNNDQAPTLLFPWPDPSGDAGYIAFAHFFAQNDTDVIIFTDEQNGVFEYDPIAGTVARPGITGVPEDELVHVVIHKERMWFTQRASTTGWYLDVGAKSGAATKFTFGGKFRHGGDLVGLYNWTLDDGAGMDDLLVAVGRAGDVIPWRGADPSAATTWNNVGTFFVGQVPKGRRIASEFGGNMRVISDFGITSMDELLKGVAQLGEERRKENNKIARFVRALVDAYGQNYGWDIIPNSNEGQVVLSIPVSSTGVYRQFVLNVTVGGWGEWRGVPGLCFNTWLGALMVGTKDGRVLRMDAGRDNVTFANPAGETLKFEMLQGFLALGAPGRFKYGVFARPDFISSQPVSVQTTFVYDYEVDAALNPSFGFSAGATGQWDTALWDAVVWGSDTLGAAAPLRGVTGEGRTLAVGMRGEAVARTTLASTDIGWTVGGEFGRFTQ